MNVAKRRSEEISFYDVKNPISVLNKDKDLGPLLKEHCQEKERLQKKLEAINAQIYQIEAFIHTTSKLNKIGPLRKVNPSWKTPQSALPRKSKKKVLNEINNEGSFQLVRNDDVQNTPPKVTITPINWEQNNLIEPKQSYPLPQLSNPSLAGSNRKI